MVFSGSTIPVTVARVGQTLERLKTFFGPKKLSELTPWHLEQFKKARREEGKAPGTVSLDVSVLKALLSKAQEWGKLAEHLGKSVKLLQNPQRKTRFLSEEEEARLLTACSSAGTSRTLDRTRKGKGEGRLF
jgi:integrase